MAAKKQLTVPQNGTQPAEIKTPMENMISGSTQKSSAKKPTSFSLDPELLLQFKAKCVGQGCTMSSVLEELIQQYINTK